MAQTWARFYNNDLLTLRPATLAALEPYIESGETTLEACIMIHGPNEPNNLPVGQYICIRPFKTLEAAQTWFDTIDARVASLGVTCLEKRLDS